MTAPATRDCLYRMLYGRAYGGRGSDATGVGTKPAEYRQGIRGTVSHTINGDSRSKNPQRRYSDFARRRADLGSDCPRGTITPVIFPMSPWLMSMKKPAWFPLSNLI